jgi:putative ABC transport system permease protein
MLTVFYRLIVRPLRRDPARTLLTAAAVALGVAVVLAIELAGNAAAGSFRSSVESLTGDADFEITATGGIPAEVVTRLSGLPYNFQIRPRIEDYAAVNGGKGVPLIGVDMLADALPNSATGTSSASGAESFSREDSIWVGDGLNLKAGDKVRLTINDRESDFTVLGVLGSRSGEVIVTDLAPATRLLGRNGKLDRILVQAPKGKSLEEWEKILRLELPLGVSLERQGAQTDENRRMLAAFRWNLRVLSYIALVVGAFLIFNTISVSVVRRRSEIGILRALGATRGQVLAAFLGEAAVFGLAGGLVGVLLGRVLAEGAVGLVAVTVQSLYVSSTPGPIALTWDLALLTLGAGLAVSLASALSPAWDASRVAPVEAMARGYREHESRLQRGRNLALGAVTAGAAWLAARQGPVEGKPMFGYLAAVLLIGAATLAIPALVTVLSSLTGRWMARLLGVEALLASRSLAGSLRRTSVLVGALATAIAMMAAVGIMVGSFRETVLVWMGDSLQADLYMRPAAPDGADRHPTFSADVITALKALPEVADVDPFRLYEVSYQGLPAKLGAGDSRIATTHGRRPLLSGQPAGSIIREMLSGEYCIVSEPFANKHHVKKGDVLDLPLGGRMAHFRIADVYYDYSNERGYIILDRSTLLRYLPDPAVSNMAVYLRPGVGLEEGKQAVERAIAGRRILVFSNRTLRSEAIKIFDRTFAITYALEGVAVFVAIMGVAGALLALVLDRRREFGLLRFLGGAGSQVRRMILFEAGLLGLLANVAGLILGVLLSLLLIFVINKQSFGWTIQFHWPVMTLLGALSVVYGATVLAGLYPARIAMRLNPIEVIHEE